MYVCMYVCIYVCMYVLCTCMYVCMHVLRSRFRNVLGRVRNEDSPEEGHPSPKVLGKYYNWLVIAHGYPWAPPSESYDSRRLRGQQPMPPSSPVGVVGSVVTPPFGGPTFPLPTHWYRVTHDWDYLACDVLLRKLLVCIVFRIILYTYLHPLFIR